MQKKKNFLIDMDGVMVLGKSLIPGADLFLKRLKQNAIEYAILTNNPIFTPRDLAHRLRNTGLDIPVERIFTSAMATARFLNAQKPDGKAYVIGESGLTEALHDVGYFLTDTAPDYVVLGEVHTYNFYQITTAIRLIGEGALFIATNPDATGPLEDGIVPACGALAALIEKASGQSPFFIGKPNPFMIRSALNYLGVHSEDTVMIGDRMDTDIIAGLMSGLDTILVMTGVSQMENLGKFPYRPTRIVNSINDIEL